MSFNVAAGARNVFKTADRNDSLRRLSDAYFSLADGAVELGNLTGEYMGDLGQGNMVNLAEPRDENFTADEIAVLQRAMKLVDEATGLINQKFPGL